MVDFYRFSIFDDYPECLHAVTMRSEDAPCSLSLALHTGEPKDRIIANRKRVERDLGGGEQLNFVVANQTHSDHIYVVTDTQTKGWKGMEDAIEDCDALMSDRPGVVLAVLTADCVPVLLYDPEHKAVAAVHAGWKGTNAHIVSKTVAKMSEVYGSDPSQLIAGIAPAIGKCCYEVGKDVAQHFFDVEEAIESKGEKYMLDLPYINKYQIIEAGLQEAYIQLSGICTACNTKHFFSYRKEQGCSGRFMSLIGISSAV